MCFHGVQHLSSPYRLLLHSGGGHLVQCLRHAALCAAALFESCTVHHKKIPRPFPHPGRHSYGLGTAVALRVAFADFSAAPWQGFEKSECCPNNSSLFLPQAAVVVVAVRVLYRPPQKNPQTKWSGDRGGALSTALEPKTSSRVTVLASSVKLKLSTTRSSKT